MGFPDKPSAHLLGANGNVSPFFLYSTSLSLSLRLSVSPSYPHPHPHTLPHPRRSSFQLQLHLQAWRLALSNITSHHAIQSPMPPKLTYQLEAYAALMPNTCLT